MAQHGIRFQGHDDPAAAFRPPPSTPSTALDQIHAQLRELASLDTADVTTGPRIQAMLLSGLRPENAGWIAQNLSPDELRTDFGTSVIVAWLGADLKAAASWLGEHDELRREQAWVIGTTLANEPTSLDVLDHALKNPDLRTAVWLAASTRLADTDPKTAIALANRLAPGEAQTNALQTIAYAWASKDPIAAERYVGSIEDPTVRQQLLVTVAKAFAMTDPELGARWLVEAVPPGNAFNETALAIVGEWTAKDPMQAAAWVAEFARDPIRDSAITIVANSWQPTNGPAATAWLQRLPDSADVLERRRKAEAERTEPKID